MFYTSFFQSYNSFKKIIHALPAYLHAFIARSLKEGVGTILNTSYTYASLTLEAALIFPFLILTLLSTMSLISVLGLHTILQIRLEETARYINSIYYITEDMHESPLHTEELTVQQFEQHFLSEDIKEACEKHHVTNGCDGISFYYTKINKNTKMVDLMINYTVEIPYIPGNLITLQIGQNTTFRLLCGTQHTSDHYDSFCTVYITPQGSVYHTKKYCTYLRKYSDIILESSLTMYEQQTGNHYRPCSYCKKYYDPCYDSTIYISNTGKSYHYTSECYYLNVSIYEFNKNEIPNNYTPCQRCAPQ